MPEGMPPTMQPRKFPGVSKSEGRVFREHHMIRRFMVMVVLAVALFPMCGDGNEL
jgi:hypothetical protein